MVAESGDAAAVYANQGDGTFPSLAATPLIPNPESGPPVSFSNVEAADLDGDGAVDLAFGFRENFNGVQGLTVSLGAGDGSFAPPAQTLGGTFPSALELVDVDGDQIEDALWVDDGFTSRLRWRLGQGDGTFGPVSVGPMVGCTAQAMIAADVDGDGDPDALVAACFGKVHVSLNAGGSFQPFVDHAVSDAAEALATGDFDEDGHLDLVTNTAVLSFPEVSLGNGDGTFQEPYALTANGGSHALAVADLDADGHADVVSLEENEDALSVLLGRGDGSFELPKVQAAAPDDARELAVADADGDGDPDVLAPNPASAGVSLWRNQGDGALAPHVRIGAGHRSADLTVADLDGDGAADLANVVEEILGNFGFPALVVMRGLAADAWTDLGRGLAGAAGVPELFGPGLLAGGTPMTLAVEGAAPGAPGALVIGASELSLPVAGGVLVPALDVLVPLVADGAGASGFGLTLTSDLPAGASLWFQAWFVDPDAVQGLSASNALLAQAP